MRKRTRNQVAEDHHNSLVEVEARAARRVHGTARPDPSQFRSAPKNGEVLRTAAQVHRDIVDWKSRYEEWSERNCDCLARYYQAYPPRKRELDQLEREQERIQDAAVAAQFARLRSPASPDDMEGLGLLPSIPRSVKWGAGGAVVLLLLARRQDVAKVAVMASESIQAALGKLRAFLTEQGIEERAARAVMSVESGGREGFVNGRPVIRYEPHVFGGQYKAVTGQALAPERVPLLPGMKAPTQAEGRKRTGGQAAEWAALAQARAINAEAADRSTSWGPFQVMGFNFKDSGFASAGAMSSALSQDPAAAYTSWISFVAKAWKGSLLKYLRDKDWAAFAAKYNGDKTGQYAKRIAAAYSKLA